MVILVCKMELSKDDLFLILQRYNDHYRDDLNKTIRFIDKIFDEFHREECYSKNVIKYDKELNNANNRFP